MPDSELIEMLEGVKPLTIPHYINLTSTAIASSRRPLLTALARSMGGVTVNHVSPKGTEAAIQLRAEQPSLYVMIWIDHKYLGGLNQFSDIPKHADWIEDRGRQGLVPDIACIHWEGQGANENVCRSLHAAIREYFPNVPITWYGQVDWRFTGSGSKQRSYGNFIAPHDLISTTLYHREAAAIGEAIRATYKNATRFAEQLAFLSWGYEHAVNVDGEIDWHMDETARRDRETWWQIGQMMAAKAKGGIVTGAFWYPDVIPKHEDELRFPLAERVQAWCDYCAGWYGKRLEMK
jgi:hypothetical protein